MHGSTEGGDGSPWARALGIRRRAFPAEGVAIAFLFAAIRHARLPCRHVIVRVVAAGVHHERQESADEMLSDRPDAYNGGRAIGEPSVEHEDVLLGQVHRGCLVTAARVAHRGDL